MLLSVFGDDVHQAEDSDRVLLLMQGDWASVAFMSIVEPVCVEIVCRGLLFARTVRVFGLAPALVIQFLIVFGVMHCAEETDIAVQEGLLSVLLAALYRVSGTLPLPIAANVLNSSPGTVQVWAESPFRIDDSRGAEEEDTASSAQQAVRGMQRSAHCAA